jgi:hypothetical protein
MPLAFPDENRSMRSQMLDQLCSLHWTICSLSNALIRCVPMMSNTVVPQA